MKLKLGLIWNVDICDLQVRIHIGYILALEMEMWTDVNIHVCGFCHLPDILQVLSGRQPVNEGRVRRLIADYVEGYKSNRRTLAL